MNEKGANRFCVVSTRDEFTHLCSISRHAAAALCRGTLNRPDRYWHSYEEKPFRLGPLAVAEH